MTPGRSLDERRQIRILPVPELATPLTGQRENAVRLQHSSPFTGVIPAAERRGIHEGGDLPAPPA